MSETTDTSKPRSRSTGFPVVPLPEAVERVSEIARYGKEHARTAFAQYLGHETSDSGPFKRKVAAFRDWGFITTSANTITLTDLAMRLAMPLDDSAFAQDLIEAFRSCAPFSGVFDSMAKGVDLELVSIANTAVHRLGVAPATRGTFASSFAKSAVFAGLAEDRGEDRVRLLGSPVVREESTTSPAAASTPVTRSAATAPAPPATGTAMALPWEVRGGRIVLQIDLDRPMPSEAFGQIGRIGEAIEALVSAIGTAPSGADASDDAPSVSRDVEHED